MALPIALIGALAGAAVLGGVASTVYASNKTASTAAKTNEESKRQFNENLAFQKYQYEDTKHYNSYENQLKMMRDAGINPSLQLGSGARTVVSTPVGGASPTASLSTPDYSSLGSGLADALSNGARNVLDIASAESGIDVNRSVSNLNDEQARGYAFDNIYKDDFWQSSNDLRRAQKGLFAKQAYIAELQAQYDRQSLGDRLWQQKWSAEETRARTESLMISNAYLPERCSQEIAQIITNQKVALMNGKASLKSATAAVMQAVNQQHAFEAQYGGNPAQRAQFFNKTLESLHEASELSRSIQYKNIITRSPLPVNRGSFTDYSDWKNGRTNSHNPFRRTNSKGGGIR